MIKDKLCDSQVSISNIVTSSHNGEGHEAEDVAEYRTIKLQEELRAWGGHPMYLVPFPGATGQGHGYTTVL